MYEGRVSPPLLKNSPYVDCNALEVKVSPKRGRKNRKEDKENQNSNQRKERPKRFKSEMRGLQEIHSNC